MLLMIEKKLREEYVMQCIGIKKLIINIWKMMIRIKNRYILGYKY